MIEFMQLQQERNKLIEEEIKLANERIDILFGLISRHMRIAKGEIIVLNKEVKL